MFSRRPPPSPPTATEVSSVDVGVISNEAVGVASPCPMVVTRAALDVVGTVKPVRSVETCCWLAVSRSPITSRPSVAARDEAAVYSCARTSTTPPTEPRVAVAFQMAYPPRLDRSTGVAGVAVIAAPVALVRFADGTASTAPPGPRRYSKYPRVYCGTTVSTASLLRLMTLAPGNGCASAAEPTWKAYTFGADRFPARSLAHTVNVRCPSLGGVIVTVVAPVAATVVEDGEVSSW